MLHAARMLTAPRFPLAVLLCALGVAGGDEITLTDGQVLDGEVISPAGAAVVDVRLRAHGMEAIRHIPREQISAIRFGISAAQKKAAEFQARRDRLGAGGTAEEWWTLAQDAKRSGDQPQFRACVSEVLLRDRNHEAARRVLGHVRHRGIWMQPDEVAVDCGQVRFRSQWVSWQDKERVLAEEAQARAEAMARLEERQRASSVLEAPSYSVSPPMMPVYRAMYWPGSFMGGSVYSGNACNHPNGSVGIAGGNSNLRWRFNWNF